MLFSVAVFGYRPELPFAWALGSFFLFAFFRSIRAKWPENYFAFDSSTDPIVSRSIAHYVAYRTVPVYVTCLFAAVGLDRSGVPEWNSIPASGRGVVGIVVVHLSLTNGRALSSRFRPGKRRPRDIGIMALQVGMAVVIACAGLLSLVGRSTLSPLVPQSRDLSIALWTGLVVAAMGGWLIDATRGRDRSFDQLIRISEASIDPSVRQYAKQRCAETGTDWQLFRSVMIYENLQRPPWVRRVERSVAGMRARGTYGIMQVESLKALTDKESIDLALDRHLMGATPESPGSVTIEEVQRLLNGYNTDQSYASRVADIYSELRAPAT